MFSAPLTFPTTPVRRSAFSKDFNRPMYSSPLTMCDSSSPLHEPDTSPIASAQARRRSQYKAPGGGSSSTSSGSSARRMTSSSSGSSGGGRVRMRALAFGDQRNPQRDFLRDKFLSRCLERGQRAREEGVRKKRTGSESSDLSSDGADVKMDVEEEEDDEALDDELFWRILANDRRRKEHALRLSYELTVGSSIDPNMEEIDVWEQELAKSSQCSSQKTITDATTPTAIISNINTPSGSQENYMDVEGAHTTNADSGCNAATCAGCEPVDEFDLLNDDEIAEMYDEYVKSVEKEEEEVSLENDFFNDDLMDDDQSTWC